MRIRIIFTLFAVLIAICLCAIYIVTPETISTVATFTFTSPRSGSRKTILYWNSFFSQRNFYLGEGYIARHCPRYNNCFATHSRFLQSVEKFDAVIFHGINDQLDEEDLPDRRSEHQKYVFVTLESPSNRHVEGKFDGYFNLTMSYQLDSDVVWTYEDIVDVNDENTLLVPLANGTKWKTIYADDYTDESVEAEKRLDQLVQDKDKIAVWYRSNCKTRSGRENYVAQLEMWTQVDSFGWCSRKIGCPRSQDCFKTQVEPNYFFYLSFENSLCEDYVTEKFFNALQ